MTAKVRGPTRRATCRPLTWRGLGIDRAIERLLAERRLDVRAERLLFALVANRALATFSKLACCEWLAGDVAIPGRSWTRQPRLARHHQ